jgi:signal peptidase I
VVLARTLDENVRRGDIVIVTDDRNEEVIKRIVGLPGETVTLFRGFVYINRQRLAEPYLAKLTYTFKRDQDNEAAVSWQLAGDEYFVLGDNRLHSADSRHYGPVPRHRLQRAVDTPENSFRPTLSDLVLLENGRVVHQNRTSSALPPTPPKP